MMVTLNRFIIDKTNYYWKLLKEIRIRKQKQITAIFSFAFRCLSFPTHSRSPLPFSPPTTPLPLNSYLHIIYTPSFENGSFLKIHLDYQTLKVTSPELSVWLGGWLQTAEQCSRLDMNAGLGCAGRREEPALCSLLQAIIFYVCLVSQQGRI